MCESSCKHWVQGEIWKFPYRFLPSSPHELRNGILIHGQRTGRHAVKAIKAIASVVRFICNGTKPQEPMNVPSIFHVNGFMAVGFHPEWLAVFRWDMNEQSYRTQISVMKAIRSDCEGQRNVKMRMRMRIWMMMMMKMMKMKMKTMIMIEGSLNSKLPTIWRVEKQMRWSKVRRKKMQLRESQKQEDTSAPNVREVAKCCVFSMIRVSGESKSRLVKAAGVESCGQRRNQK